jgi:hypothetical protein
MRTDRKEDLDQYYNDHLKLAIIRRLQMVETWAEIKGLEDAVWGAIQREEDLDKTEKVEFEKWKANK